MYLHRSTYEVPTVGRYYKIITDFFRFFHESSSFSGLGKGLCAVPRDFTWLQSIFFFLATAKPQAIYR